MLLKKKVRAGILLYALLMLAVFSLLLQFYLHRQEAESQIAQVAKQEAIAYIMAQMAFEEVEKELENQKEKLSEKNGQGAQGVADDGQKEYVHIHKNKSILLFKEGETDCQLKNGRCVVNVRLNIGKSYRYLFKMNREDDN